MIGSTLQPRRKETIRRETRRQEDREDVILSLSKDGVEDSPAVYGWDDVFESRSDARLIAIGKHGVEDCLSVKVPSVRS